MTSKTDQAYVWIKTRLRDQTFPPGARLTLKSIAEEIGSSTVPVREAVRQLAAEGLLTFEHNMGARVPLFAESEYKESMMTLAILEGAATALSAPRLTAKEIRSARNINDQMIVALKDFDPRNFTLLNQEFHATLFQQCKNMRLLKLVRSEWDRLGRLRQSTFDFAPGRAHGSVQEHEQIILLIESGAPIEEIEKATRKHRCATLEAYIAGKSSKVQGPDGISALQK